MLAEILSPLTEFGVAGLMGALWVWERRLSRRREQQLDDAHHRIVGEARRADALMELVRSNTAAIERFAQAQATLTQLVRALHEHDECDEHGRPSRQQRTAHRGEKRDHDVPGR